MKDPKTYTGGSKGNPLVCQVFHEVNHASLSCAGFCLNCIPGSDLCRRMCLHVLGCSFRKGVLAQAVRSGQRQFFSIADMFAGKVVTISLVNFGCEVLKVESSVLYSPLAVCSFLQQVGSYLSAH
jgi:hypothetical protein